MNEIRSPAPEIKSMLYAFGFVLLNEKGQQAYSGSVHTLGEPLSLPMKHILLKFQADQKMHPCVQATHAEKHANCTGCRALT